MWQTMTDRVLTCMYAVSGTLLITVLCLIPVR